MFPNKALYEINREERNYGFLLLSSLIYEEKFRLKFLEVLKNHPQVLAEKIKPSDAIDVYAEVAMFRDAWFSFGNYKKYDANVHASRVAVVENILKVFSIDPSLINEYKTFWTGEIGLNKSKLWYPGKWNIQELREIQKLEPKLENKLVRIRWALNAKPDILITAKKWAVFIELKIESGVGANGDGYRQYDTLDDIIQIAKKTMPQFSTLAIYKVLISQNQSKSIKWNEFIGYIENEMVKKYMNHIPRMRCEPRF